jgi:hypothetical protein
MPAPSISTASGRHGFCEITARTYGKDGWHDE